MERITEGVSKIAIVESQKKNLIQASNTKKPLFFYVNVVKRYMQQHNEVELSALGMAISTIVSIAEILKNNGFAVEKTEIMTSTVEIKDDWSRSIQKGLVLEMIALRSCTYLLVRLVNFPRQIQLYKEL